MADQITLPRAVVEQALEALEDSRRSHHYCEDTWYSCPQHEDGCANEAEGDECNCGADKANEKIDHAITALRAALAQAEPVQPVEGVVIREGLPTLLQDRHIKSTDQRLYTAPQQRKPLTEEEIDAGWRELDGEASTMFMRVLRKFARAIERAHGIKESGNG